MVNVKLPKIEIFFYFFVWTASICYSTYHVYLAGHLFDYSAIGDDFSDSWHGYKKDMADYEWATWIPFILHILPPWIGAHIVLSELTRWISPQIFLLGDIYIKTRMEEHQGHCKYHQEEKSAIVKHCIESGHIFSKINLIQEFVPALYCVITCSFLLVHFGPACMLFALSQVFIYFTILRLKSVTLVWLFGIPFLLLSCFALHETWEYIGRDEDLYTKLVISTTWVHLRSLSFSLDLLASPNTLHINLRNFYDLLGYGFYFPTYFFGPFILYSNFGPYMYRPFERWTSKRVGMFLFNMLRYLFWAAFTEASLYFLYIHALQYHMQTVVRLGEWTLYGLGFLLGLFFCLKYIVVYGLASTIANFDGYIAPPPPKCVARIHLYTDMWRVFDVGFYQFMHKYIYSPLCAGHRQLSRRVLASAVCFCYVFLWHGVHLSIFTWSLLNFLGVSLVSFGSSVSKTPAYRNWEKQTLSEANSRRVSALLSAPMFIMGPISAFYFFSGMTIGNTFIKQLFFTGSWIGLITLLFVSYCMCQVSIETKNWEESRDQKLKSH